MKALYVGLWLFLVLGCLSGWVLNIIKIVSADVITGFVLLRIAGIFLAPLGVVLGYL